ncbi:hypothetical protein [Saccharopolyspora taberi]|uniref:Glycosyltransferase RgtA/B/C/D-like domain-containing protein n=1 Tax=Saccharopolyspora taberi TaxID=60895 RepID=A0ABN3VMC9_9PSEU
MTATTAVSALPVETQEEQPQAETARRRTRPWSWLSVLGGTAAIGAHGSLYGNWFVDDAAITFAYSRSIAEGLGPVVQPGADPVEGFSNPTWTVLLAVGRLLGLFDHGSLFGVPDYVLFPKGLALLCVAAMLTVCHGVARRVTSRAWLVTLVVGGLLAVIPSFVIWVFSGLENSLYALVIVGLAAVLFHASMDDRLPASKVAAVAGLLAATAALTRPEGLIYAGAYPLAVLIHLRRHTLGASVRGVVVSVLAFAVPVGAYFTWRYLEFGRLLSNPSVAKAQGIPEVADLMRSAELVGYAGPLAVLALAVVLGMALGRSTTWRRGLASLLVPLMLAVIAFAVLKPDWMAQYRFATPIWALGALVAVLSAVEVFRNGQRRGRVVLAAGLVMSVVPSVYVFGIHARAFNSVPNISMCYVADRLGRVPNAYADIIGATEASILLPDLGGSALTSRLHLVDLGGLVEPRIADFMKNEDMAGMRDWVFEEVRPTFIHSRSVWGDTGISADPRMRDYVQIYRYELPGAPAGDWVRRDAVPDEEALRKLREYADTVVAEVDHKDVTNVWPSRTCGPTLRPGQTEVGQV